MENLYVVKFADGSYYWDYPTQICYRKEDSKYSIIGGIYIWINKVYFGYH